MFTRFVVTVLVCEPTVRSVGVYRQFADYARDFGVRLVVVGNKVTGPGDVAYLQDEIGASLIGCFTQSGFVRALEQGRHLPLDELEPDNRALLDLLARTADTRVKDWDAYQRTAIAFHLRNAAAWASRAAGEDLSGQIDPDFRHGPAAQPPGEIGMSYSRR